MRKITPSSLLFIGVILNSKVLRKKMMRSNKTLVFSIKVAPERFKKSMYFDWSQPKDLRLKMGSDHHNLI